MAFVRVAAAGDLADGEVMEVLHGDAPIAVCRVDGAWHAISGVCPHRGGPLGQGVMEGRNVLCPWHLWAFDCLTGESDTFTDCRVQSYAVQVQGDDVLVDLA